MRLSIVNLSVGLSLSESSGGGTLGGLMKESVEVGVGDQIGLVFGNAVVVTRSFFTLTAFSARFFSSE